MSSDPLLAVLPGLVNCSTCFLHASQANMPRYLIIWKIPPFGRDCLRSFIFSLLTSLLFKSLSQYGCGVPGSTQFGGNANIQGVWLEKMPQCSLCVPWQGSA